MRWTRMKADSSLMLAFALVGMFLGFLCEPTAATSVNFNFAGMIPRASSCPTAQPCPSSSPCASCPEDSFVVFTESLSVNASVLTPASSGYDAIYTRFFTSSSTYFELPMIIVRAAEVDDVVKAVNYARENDLELGVKGGTHGWNGLAIPRRGLLLDLSLMKRVEVHADTVSFQAGATCGDLDAATRPQNRAVVCGSCYTVGAGFLAHGGYGALTRLHGLAIDNLISVDLVTADGELVTASALENTDLFWAVRGALPNFGVAVSFVVKTHDVSSFYGGTVRFYPSAFVPIAQWIRDRSTDPNLHVRVVLGFNAAVTGGRVLTVEVAVWGTDLTPTEKATYLSSLTSIADKIDQNIGIRTYFDQQLYNKAAIDNTRPGMKGITRSGSNAEGSSAFMEEFFKGYMAITRSPYSSALNLWGGAVSQVPRNATAFWGRGVVYDWFLNFMFHDPTTNITALAQTADSAASAIAATSGATPDVYINWLSTNQDGIVERAYGENLPRLRQLKATWDPTNFFRNNYNILPASK